MTQLPLDFAADDCRDRGARDELRAAVEARERLESAITRARDARAAGGLDRWRALWALRRELAKLAHD